MPASCSLALNRVISLGLSRVAVPSYCCVANPKLSKASLCSVGLECCSLAKFLGKLF